MNTRWMPILDGSYEVSEAGGVRSKRGELTPFRDGRGYLCVSPSVDGVQRIRTVHALVLAAFVGPRPTGRLVRHLNGDKSDNRLLNLAYGDAAENADDSVRHGTHFNAAKLVCKHGHDLTGGNVYVWDGRRHCRACNAAAQRRRKARLRVGAS